MTNWEINCAFPGDKGDKVSDRSRNKTLYDHDLQSGHLDLKSSISP